jgi:SNF2 family DNA or RNA helicase
VENVEPALSDHMDNVMFERIADLRDRIADLSEVIGWLKTFLDYDEDELKQLEAMRRSLQEVLDEIRRRTHRINDGQRIVKQQMRPYQASLEAAQREWARLMAELEAQARERAQREQLELLVENAPWRDRALKHQWEGAYRLSSVERGILGDKPGLGKTLQSIMTVDMLKALGKAMKVLIFCPKPVLDGFERDFKKFSPDQFVFIVNQAGGAKSHVLDVAAAMDTCTILTNYEVWRKDKTIVDKLIACQFDTVILDEAHVLKDWKSGTAKGIKRIVHAENKCSNCGGLSFGSACPACGQYPTELFEFRSVKNVFPMTGTPILNKPQDLFTMLHLVDDIAFPTESAFLADFCIRKCAVCKRSYNCLCGSGNSKWVWTFDHGGEERLLKRLGMKFTARSRDSAGVVMPPQEVKHHYFELDPEQYPKQAEFVELLRDKARLRFNEDKVMTQVETLAWYTRMRQSAIWPDGIRVKEFDHEGNFLREWRPEVGESILMDEGEKLMHEALENDNRVIIFCKFKEALKEMERRIIAHPNGIPYVRYDGDLSEEKRKEAQHDFDLTVTDPKDAKFKVMLAQYDSAKVGLNLHGAQEVIMLDREWNPSMEEQAMDRVRRIGSTHDTIVHILHCEGTATELMDAIIEMKAEMRDGFESENDRLQAAMKKFLEGK